MNEDGENGLKNGYFRIAKKNFAVSKKESVQTAILFNEGNISEEEFIKRFRIAEDISDISFNQDGYFVVKASAKEIADIETSGNLKMKKALAEQIVQLSNVTLGEDQLKKAHSLKNKQIDFIHILRNKQFAFIAFSDPKDAKELLNAPQFFVQNPERDKNENNTNQNQRENKSQTNPTEKASPKPKVLQQ